MKWTYRQLIILLIGLYHIESTQAVLDEFVNFEDSCKDLDDISCDAGKCVDKTKRCDGAKDCLDGADEFDCDQYLCKEPNYFRCANNLCVSSSFVCDNENDCGDLSDEKNCTNFKVLSSENCEEDEWKCKDNLCIPKEWVCNGVPDCLDGSDETLGCSVELNCTGFKCHNGHCIPLEWHCDKHDDCMDNSDELSCDLITKSQDCNVDNRKFLCKNNHTCIDMKLLCDGKSHCPDTSDEGENCKADDKQCAKHNCSHDCVQTPNGPLCLCPQGYHQLADKLCQDINECNTYGICDQKCKNIEGSYSCFCDKKYTLQSDNRTCKVSGGEAVMLFSTKTEIRAYFLTSQLYYSVASKLKQVVGVSFDGNHIYWTDIHSENEAIVRADEDGSNRELLVTSGLGAPEDLAVDWITGNIYFTDADMQHIGVCSNKGLHCTILVNEDIDKPRGIVLNPAAGEMYWSDWGKRPEIARSKMDGTEDFSFVSNNIRWPNGLTIDYPNQRLYWVDAKLSTVESILLDGTDRRVILEGIVKHPYAIAVFEDKLYWSDWATHSIQYCDKFTGKDQRVFVREKTQYIYGIHIYHSALKQRTDNPCKNSFCSDMCLLNGPTSYSCSCPQGKILAPDNHTCIQTEKKRILAIGAGDLLILIQHQKLGKHEIEALPVSFSFINYITYDSISGAIIVSDKMQKKIYSVNLKTQEKVVLVANGIGEIEGMDFDYFTNNLYWCDSEQATLEVFSLTTKERKTIMGNLAGHVPLDVALVPEEGVMFVAFKKPDFGVHIDRIHMDGQGGRTHVVEQGLIGPTVNLVYDPILKRIFWTDSHTGNIESTSVDGDDRHAFRSLMTEPQSIAILGSDLFWTNQNSQRIYWADKHNNAFSFNKKITLDIAKSVETLHLTSVTGIRVDSHPCLTNNGDCSHLCLQSLKDIICACPLGQLLNFDNKTCFAPKHCTLNEYKCSETEICIPKTLRCNGNRDCLNGDDEENCLKEQKCSLGMFQCLNGDCIDKNKACDLHFDCLDKSDELNCYREGDAECSVGKFRCKDGACIADRFVCDGIQQCNDGSDEENCHTLTCNAYEYRCISGECIPKTWECDHESDCQDGSDEHEHCGPVTCGVDTFTCNNGRCVDKNLKCNFIDDCGDLSDEFGCEKDENFIHQCLELEFLCNINSTDCLPEDAKCNGTVECPNGEDEKHCESCQEHEFECKNKKCISENWICDHHDDCGDLSDEEPKFCNQSEVNRTKIIHDRQQQQIQVPCENGFRCKSGHCIEFGLVCNGVENCYDGSDEYGTCETSCEINNNPCSNICLKTPSGPKCSCESGYKLKGDAQSCEDTNECENHPSPCSQNCKNTPGSFICSCYAGYDLRSDRKSCKAIGEPMSIIFSTSNEIRKLSPSINTLELIYSEDSPKITGLDMSFKTGEIYFSLEQMGSIHKINLKTKKTEYVIGLGNPQKISVDWITGNIYFVDGKSSIKSIKVCHLKEQKCAKIQDINMHDQISSISVDAVNKYLFYSTTSWWLFNSPTSVIYRCNLDGSKVYELVKGDLGYVSGLSFDYNKKKLYYADQHFNQIQAINYDGTNRHIVLSNTYVHHPMDLNLFEDHIYFLTPNGYMVKCKIYGEQKICSLLKLHAYNVEMFVLIQESKQPNYENICLGHNCTHLCIQSEVGVQCVCGDGKSIKEGGICDNISKNAASINDDDGIVIKVKGYNTVSTEYSKTHSSLGSTISALVIILLILIAAVFAYKYIKSRNQGKFDISMRFQNPAYGLTIPDTGSIPNSLHPGQHEYTNPVLINNHEMQTAANVILQKTRQNPFVLTDAANSDSEINEYDKKKLINL